jgi:hypothetical protein
MDDVTEKETFKEWKNYVVSKGFITPLWDKEYEDFYWIETFMTDEIPKNNIWNTSATITKLKLEDYYKKIKISKECTKHYMSLTPDLSLQLSSILKNFDKNKLHYNFLKLTPGHNLIWHYDSYSTFIRHNNVIESQIKNISRTIVMMEDWTFGQVLQVGNSIETHWNKGDTYTWIGDQWHGVANFGFSDFVVMQVTWL